MEGFLNRKIFKIISISLLTICVVGMLTGCGNETEDDVQNHIYKSTELALSDGYSLNGKSVVPYLDGFCVYGKVNANDIIDESMALDGASDDFSSDEFTSGEFDLDAMSDEYIAENASEQEDVPTEDEAQEEVKAPNGYEIWNSSLAEVNSGNFKNECDYLSSDKSVVSEGQDENIESTEFVYTPTRLGRECFYFFDREGNEVNKFYYDLMDEDIVSVVFGPAGEVYTLGYGMIVEAESPEDVPNYYSANHFGIIRKFDKNGELLKEIRVDDNPEVNKQKDIMPGKETEKFYNLFTDNENIYLYAAGYMLVYDSNLELQNIIAKSKVSPYFANAKPIVDKSGKVYLKYYDNSTYTDMLSECDLKKGTVEKGIHPLGEKYIDALFPGFDSQFIMCKNGSVYEYNYADQNGSLLIDFTASNIASSFVQSIVEIDDHHLASIFWGIEDDNLHLTYLSKVNPEDVTVKTTITLGAISLSSEIKQAVFKFNKTNDEYNIKIMDYNALYGDSEFTVSDSVLEKLNVDIISGRMPDILVTSDQFGTSLSIDPYIRKDLIEDLYPYIESDPDMSISDFDAHIFDIFSKEGKLYALVPSYSVSTTVIKKSLAEGRTSWTVNDAIETMEKYDSVSFEQFTDRDQLLKTMLVQAGEQFVDTQNATCSFNSQEFKDAIRFLERTPENQNDVNMDFTYDERFKKNMMIASDLTLNSFSGLNSMCYWQFNEPGVCIGFPTNEGIGSCICPTVKMSMSSKSKYKDGCWEFMRYFLSDEYQSSDNAMEYAFPIKNEYMDIKCEKAKEAPYDSWIDENGNEVVYEYTYVLNGKEEKVPGLTQEEVDSIRLMISQITHANEFDAKILQIVKDEIKEYYNGNASLDDVCNRIQSRVQIYLYEIQ